MGESLSTGFVVLRFHDLRHLAITKLSESQASDQTIMSIVGHLNRAILEHYSHIRAAAKRKAAADVAMWLAIKTKLGLADSSVTADMKTNFLGAAKRTGFAAPPRS